MSPESVRPYVKAQKNDDRDAEAIAEAATRPTMRFVALKSEDQLDHQTLHRLRDRLVAERTSLMNQIRSILIERGIAIAKGRRRLAAALDDALADGAALSARMVGLIGVMAGRLRELDARIAGFDDEFAARARSDEAARRLATIVAGGNDPTPQGADRTRTRSAGPGGAP